jgi:transposase
MDEVLVPQPRGRPRKRPEAIAGDRAYDADWIRQWCTDKGIESAIPARENTRDGPGRPPTCDEQKYRDRNTVERCVGHLKERRRLVVRYEKKASHPEATASSHGALGLRQGIPESIIIRRSLGRKGVRLLAVRFKQTLKRRGKKIKRNLPVKPKNHRHAAGAIYKNHPPGRQGVGTGGEVTPG